MYAPHTASNRKRNLGDCAQAKSARMWRMIKERFVLVSYDVEEDAQVQ